MPPETDSPKSTLGDWMVFFLLFAALLGSCWFLVKSEDTRFRELTITIIAASAALMLRFALDEFFPRKLKSKVLSETLLALATGAIASGVLLWFKPSETKAPPESENYEVTWTFSDSSRPGMVNMRYTQINDVVGKKGLPVWKGTFFEPYLWNNQVRKHSIACADDRTAFEPNSPISAFELPVTNAGFYLDLDRNNPDHKRALFTQDNEKKWLKIDVSADVPYSYWDISAARTKLEKRANFKIVDETSRKNLVFIMAGPGDLYASNLDKDGKLAAHEVRLFPKSSISQSVKCQVYWCPVEVVSSNSFQNITNRFHYVP